ncbi:MAG: site-specific DNA-methyltransferase [Anaerolineae bacterium]|nr:site-specific DNA-methyltransferase [Anaerolineae bacterium]
MDGKSLDLTAEKIAQLRSLFPEVVTEDKIDFARLQDFLGGNLAFPGEHYELSWAGKAQARKEIQKQTTATLVPDKANSINFDATENIFIEGENMEVLRVLQRSYFGKIKMIYIDPPYNTGNDSFVYPDDYAERLADYQKRTGITDEEGFLNKQDLWRKNTRENGQFHSVWLSMMYPRLYLARNLLREDGVVFVSIDDNEAANLKVLMDEVFGEENFIDCVIWKKRYGGGAKEKYLVTLHEYVLFYARDINFVDPIFVASSEESIEKYYKLQDENFALRGGYRTHPLEATKSMGDRPNLVFPIISPDGTPILPKRQFSIITTSCSGFCLFSSRASTHDIVQDFDEMQVKAMPLVL